MSDSQGSSIVRRMTDVMTAVGAVAKKDRNTQGGGFNFRGIDAVMNKVGPQLREHGIVVFPSLVESHHEIVTVRSGAQMDMVRLIVDYTFMDVDGDSLTVRVPGTAFDSGDKAQSKAMSVAFRTALLQSLCLPTDEPDPDAESYDLGAAGEALADEAGPLIAAATTDGELRGIWERYKNTLAGQAVTEMVKARRDQLQAATPQGEPSASAG